MPIAPIRRTSDYVFEAFQFDASDANAFSDFVSSRPTGNIEVQFDENGNGRVAIGEHTIDGTIFQTVYDGDYIVRVFSKWWTVIPNNEFSNDWAVIVEP